MATAQQGYKNEEYTSEDYDDLELEFLKNDTVQLIKKKTIGLFRKEMTIDAKVKEMFQLFRTHIPQMSYYKEWFNREGDEIRIINRVLEKEDFVKILIPRMQQFLTQFSEGFDDTNLDHMEFLSKFIEYFVLSIKHELEKIHLRIRQQTFDYEQQILERLRKTLEKERRETLQREEDSRIRKKKITTEKEKTQQLEERLATLKRSGGRRTIRKSRKTKTKKSSKKSRKVRSKSKKLRKTKSQKSRRMKRRIVAN